MGRPGPIPTPTELKKLRGNPGKRPLPTEVEPPAVRAPSMPKGLPPEAQMFWKRYAPDLAKLGLLTRVDTATLQMAATHWWVCQRAMEELTSGGGQLMREDEDGVLRKHPLLQVLRDNSGAFLRYVAQFGMSPSARVGLGDVGPPPVEDPYQAFLANRNNGHEDEDADG